MEREEILKRIIELVDLQDKKITEDMTFKNDLQLDSLSVFEIENNIEDEFDIEIDTDENITTVGELVDFVQEKVNE